MWLFEQQKGLGQQKMCYVVISISSGLVDEGLGKAGGYPFRDVEGRGVILAARELHMCLPFSQLQSSLDFHLTQTIQLSALGP